MWPNHGNTTLPPAPTQYKTHVSRGLAGRPPPQPTRDGVELQQPAAGPGAAGAGSTSSQHLVNRLGSAEAGRPLPWVPQTQLQMRVGGRKGAAQVQGEEKGRGRGGPHSDSGENPPWGVRAGGPSPTLRPPCPLLGGPEKNVPSLPSPSSCLGFFSTSHLSGASAPAKK